MGDADRYVFELEWFDNESKLTKRFILQYYSGDKSLELYDIKNHRVFLRRIKVDNIELENLYKGALVTIMMRQMKVVGYGDKKTQSKFEQGMQRTFCLIKPEAFVKAGEIISYIVDKKFKITKMKMGIMAEEAAEEFYKEHKLASFYHSLIMSLSSGPSLAIEMLGDDAIQRFREYIGPTDPDVAKKDAPNSLRALYGLDIGRNGLHGSKDEEHLALETKIWFSNNPEIMKKNIVPTLKLKNTTCCIIKPHAIYEGNLGHIIDAINKKGYEVTAMQMFLLESVIAEEFFEVYKGVIPEYQALITQMTSGPCLAMEIYDPSEPECTTQNFRKICGPVDPDIAKKLRPETIRARFGKDKVLNGVHCTDLPEDALLEVEYFFRILQT